MAETREGLPQVGWNQGDPPIGFYWLALQCQRCDAPSGHIWPEADARAPGTMFVFNPGSQAGICLRCKRTNTMMVTSELPPKPSRVESWSY